MTETDGLKDLHENFEPARDALFFKVSQRGVVSFHGRNFHIVKRMTNEQLASLTNQVMFLQLTSTCYVNVGKITSVEPHHIHFGEASTGSKQLPIPWLKQPYIRARLSENPPSRRAQ